MPNDTILVVEDDAVIRQTIQSILTMEGYRVLAAGNGREALETLAASLEMGDSPPKAILLDLMLPEMNGWQFLEAKEANPLLREIPVIPMSASAPSLAKKQPDGLLAKPFEVETLLARLRSVTRSIA